MSNQGAIAARANLCQKRILFDLDSPALVLSEMEMADVETVKRKEVDEPADFSNREKVAANIKMLTAPAEPRPVIDLHARQRPIGSLRA